MTASTGKATAQAQPNVALIKYWGKRDEALNLPAAGSLSITLDALHTRTTAHFDPTLDADDVVLDGTRNLAHTRRIAAFVDLFRERAQVDSRVRIASMNDFPTGAGLASSASGFAALAVALDHALGLGLDARALSRLARRGSGSAARSLFGGFVEMAAGGRDDGEDAVATPLLDAAAWPLEVVVAVTTRDKKATSSRDGMRHTRETSPFYRDWIATTSADLTRARAAVLNCDFEELADLAEASCLAMHAVMLAARPGLVYWNPATMECIRCIRALRRAGSGVFFTIDAGPQVKAVCLPGAGERVAAALGDAPGVAQVLSGGLGAGARITGEAG